MPGLAGVFHSTYYSAQRFVEKISRQWGHIRAFLGGLRYAWVSATSVLLGLLLFTFAPQTQDLFLEVRGSTASGSLFWLGFYAATLIAWVLPVYVSSHWILYKFGNQSLTFYGLPVVEDWVCRAVPRVLAVACIGAVLVGQLLALMNAPTIFNKVSVEHADELEQQFNSICLVEQAQGAWQGLLCYSGHLHTVAETALIGISSEVGAENVVLMIYVAIVVLAAFFLLTHFSNYILKSRKKGLRLAFYLSVGWLITGLLVIFFLPVSLPWSWLNSLIKLVVYPYAVLGPLAPLNLLLVYALIPAGLHRVPVKWVRWPALGLWWLVTAIGTILYLAVLGVSIYGMTIKEIGEPLGIGHLALLPPITLLLGVLVWWGLGPQKWGEPTRFERLMPWRASRLVMLFDQARERARAWSPLYKALLLVSLVLLAFLFTLHPVGVTAYVYRALMLPLFFGLLVPVLTYISHFSFRVHAPIVALTVIAISITFGARTWVHDVRGDIKREAQRPTLEETVERWAAVNDCDLPLTSRLGPAHNCPKPIIIAAAGGASRAAFLVGAVVGELLDRGPDPFATGADASKRWPFARQLFAISGVSGGALGAAVTYAALADSQLPDRAINGKGAPPCKRVVAESEYFAPDRQWHNNWRNCLELILSGDFLSPVFVGLIGNDLFGALFRHDRAGILEDAWERRYADLTGDDTHRESTATLARSLVDLRTEVLSPDTLNWLPVLLLNGTSVATGRRVVTSDVDTLFSDVSLPFFSEPQARSRVFHDAYDYHELLENHLNTLRQVTISSDGQTLLAIVNGKAQLWDLKTENERRTIELPELVGYDSKVRLSPNGQLVLLQTSRSSRKLYLLDAETGEQKPFFEFPDDGSDILGFEFAADSKHVLVSSQRGARLISAESGKELCFLASGKSEEDLLAARLSDAGDKVVTSTNAGKLQLWDAATCTEIRTFDSSGTDTQAAKSNTVLFSPDGRRMMSAVSYGNKLLIWDTDSGKRLHELELPSYFVDVFFSPDGRHLAVRTRGSYIVWRVEDGKKIGEYSHEFRRLETHGGFSADGRQLLIVSDTLGAELLELNPDLNPDLKPDLKPDSKPDLKIEMVALHSFQGRDAETQGAMFYYGDTRILTWNANGVVHLWDAESGRERGELRVSRSSLAACRSCDLGLSTAATMSARFPVISPPGTIRDGKGNVIDRVVDGGYYESFGAVTALELAKVLKARYWLEPAVILINNDPTVGGMSCITPDSRLAYPHTSSTLSFATFRSSIDAMMATRSARGSYAAVELCSELQAKNFAFITVKPDPTNPNKELTMSWWLSKHVQSYLDEQVDTTGNGAINDQAFGKIKSWQLR